MPTKIDTLTSRFNEHENEHIRSNHEERIRMLEEFYRKARDGSFEFNPIKKNKYGNRRKTGSEDAKASFKRRAKGA